jgi:hypothetical protein
LASTFGFGAGRSADRLNLDLRKRGTEARLPAIARLGAPLADADLLPAHVADDLRGHLHARRKVGVTVAAGEQDVRLERLALVGCEPVDQQSLALADAVLLAAE